MTGRIGAAVVGLGVGEQHAAAYARLDECELVYVHDLDRGRAEEVAARFGARAAVDGLADVLADPRVDLVSIASFDDVHFEQALAALRAGKHVFVEKPLCRSVAELRELKRALEAAPHLRLASNLLLRSAPLYAWLRERLAAGELGRIYAFDGDYLYGRLHKLTEGWRGGVADYSVMLGGGIHLVDLMLWITGERPESVTASGNRISTEGTGFRYHDFVAATFRFPSGLVGRVTANFGSVQPHQHAVRLFGTAATVVHDDAGPRLFRDRDGPAEPLRLAAEPESKGALVARFVESVLHGGASPAAVEHELAVVSACAAVDRALAEGGAVDVEYV